jgi:hypothetical protein
MSEKRVVLGANLSSGEGEGAAKGERERFPGPGGTSGGTGSFLLGLVLSAIGAYLIMNQAMVSSGYWSWFGAQTFGLTLVPLLVGLALLFFDGRSALGWVLAVAGLFIIIAGILVNLQVYFRATTVYNAVIMFGFFAVGLGLMARSLRAR